MSVVHIFVHGLIALVPVIDGGGANHMTALLIDARNQPPEFAKCFASHQPAITVHTEETADCEEAGCEPSGENDCICALVHKEVSLQAQIPPDMANKKQNFDAEPKSALPFYLNDARDFSYVANLSRMGYELDTRYLEPSPPDALIARMSFPFDSVSACSLGTRHDEGGDNVHPMSFRPISTLESAGERNQALAQMVAATLKTSPGPVTLTITDFKTGEQKSLTLMPMNDEYWIELSNMRINERGEHDLFPDDPCDDGVERDFAFFYNLVKNPPDWNDRPIPHIKYTRWKSVKDLEISECKKNMGHKLPNSHPICALATFVPSTPAE